MKILSAKQIRALDAYTIEHEPIKSIDLMERASNAFVKWFLQHFPNKEGVAVKIFCGPGNNGGDGLAVARILNRKFYNVEVFVCHISKSKSPDFEKNLKRLPWRRGLEVQQLNEGDALPSLENQAIIIDAIFGSGLNRPVTGYWADLIQYLNGLPNTKVAIDIPSGLYADKHSDGISIAADYTLSFEVPKTAFFFPENQDSVGQCFIQPIGLSQAFIAELETDKFLISKDLVQSILKKRKKFSHKGTFGHALLMMGSLGKMGATILATKACLRSGAGLVTVHIPKCGYQIIQISCPEAMASLDEGDNYLATVPATENYKAIGIGCGIDQKAETTVVLRALLADCKKPMVLDADALNIIAQDPTLLEQLPPNCILTPHPKEFERLFGRSDNDFDRNNLHKKVAKKYNCIVILKGANTCVATPEEVCYFNTTGNPGMATGGSGDVLTGILAGLLAQGYSAKAAAIFGVYLHGLAGDLAVEKLGQESMIAGDLVDNLGAAFNAIKE